MEIRVLGGKAILVTKNVQYCCIVLVVGVSPMKQLLEIRVWHFRLVLWLPIQLMIF